MGHFCFFVSLFQGSKGYVWKEDCVCVCVCVYMCKFAGEIHLVSKCTFMNKFSHFSV